MIKKYVYAGVEYKTEYAVRMAIGKAERKAFPAEPEENKQSFWALHGVVYSEEEEPAPSVEKLTAYALAKRNRLLSESDYYVLPDYQATETGLAEVKVYRQALRDITRQIGFPTEIKWPIKPAVLGN